MNELLDRIQRGIDYVEERLGCTIELTEVSRAAGMSHWHFQRTFRAMTGETLMTYVRSRRLSRASEQLLGSDARIIDIALDAGFESQESFTRAFHRTYGLNPGELRRLGQRRLFPRKLRIHDAYLEHLRESMIRKPKIEERPALQVVGKRTSFYGIDSEKNNVAERIPPLWDDFLPHLSELDGPKRTICYGVVSSDPGDEQLSYLACTDHRGSVPAQMVVDTLPEGTWAVFSHRGPTADLDHTVSYIYSTWLPTSKTWKHSLGPDVEIYGSDWHPTAEDSVTGYAVPVRPIEYRRA